ncbi:MAG: helix-turn-helix domain-containing protein [Yoonia sp.]
MTQIPDFTLYGKTTPFPDVVHVETFLARAPEHGWTISPHRHSNMAQLFAVKTGRVMAMADGETHDLAAGSFLFLPVQIVHELEIEPQTDGTVMSFPQPILGSIGPASSDLSGALGQMFTGVVTPQLSTLLSALSDVVGSPQTFRQQIAVGLAHAVLGALGGLAPIAARSPASARLAQFDTLIATHQSEGWGAAKYAAALNMTTGHLSRLCRDTTGTGASTYIERALMEEACRMLAFTRMPMAEIGYRLGYADPSYFSKRFRVVRGQTPTAYRQQFAD